MAQLRGVDVLNVNELANALKPVVLPGEIMKVFILKEGKEYNQGVAYLDDGTMVVVDNARKMISKTIDIVVTSVLQTTAGKMIFGRYIEAWHGAAARAGLGRASASGSRCSRARRHAAGASAPRRRRDGRQTPVRARVNCESRERASLSLVADCLLPDPGHQRLHDRARRGVASCRACSTGAATSRTAARAPGRG